MATEHQGGDYRHRLLDLDRLGVLEVGGTMNESDKPIEDLIDELERAQLMLSHVQLRYTPHRDNADCERCQEIHATKWLEKRAALSVGRYSR